MVEGIDFGVGVAPDSWLVIDFRALYFCVITIPSCQVRVLFSKLVDTLIRMSLGLQRSDPSLCGTPISLVN